MDPAPIVVSVTVGDNHSPDLSILCSKMLFAAFSVMEGSPACAAKLDVEFEDEDYSLGVIVVRDRETFLHALAAVNEHHGEPKLESTDTALLGDLLKKAGIDVEDLKRKLNEPPHNPELN